MYTDGMTYEQFLRDYNTQDAVVRNLGGIGEAAKSLSTHLKKAHSQVPWRELAGMRDKMIHHYFGINYETAWTIAKEELPCLLPLIEDVLAKG